MWLTDNATARKYSATVLVLKPTKMNTSNITETITFKMVDDEARKLSVKLVNTMYVIQRNNSLYTTMVKEDGVVLSAWNFGNKII